MVYVPNPREPSGVFEGQIIENALTILTRDFQEALDHYYPSQNLPDFAELEIGPALRNVFPCGAIEPRTNRTEGAEDNSHILEICRFRVYVAVTGDGPKATTRKLFKYVRVVHLVLQNAKQDFFSGMSNAFGLVLIDFEHAYDVTREKDSIISRAAGIEVSIGIRER